jgi:rubrerythrin
MDILEYACEIEMRGEQLYHDMAAQSSLPEISSIFAFLAEEERHHYDLLQAMSRPTTLPPIGKSFILSDSKAVFEKLTEQFTAQGAIKIDREYPLSTALEFENKSVSLYEKAIIEMMISPANENSCLVLAQIVEQEKNHVRLIDSIREFQRHPYEWLENAEWNHLDEY